MFVIPQDIHGSILKPTLSNYIETKTKRPLRKAKINLPPNVIIPRVEKRIERPRIATPTHNPPCIEKILKQRKEQLEAQISTSSSDSE